MATLSHMNRKDVERFHPEIAADNFSVLDCDITFYSYVRAILLRYGSRDVLDYGAGRNQYVQDFDESRDSYLIRDLRDLRQGGAQVTAADVSEAVRSHPTSHRQVVFDPKQPLPFADGSFDLIVTDFVVEHVEDPEIVAQELQRVLRPGGWIAMRTPSKWGYLRIAATLTANSLHEAALKRIQPNRKGEDIFPTFYRLNSKRDVERHFTSCDVHSFTDSWEPAYFFGKPWLYRLFLILHKFLPKSLGTASVFLIRKKP